jgi:hypothetical protein
MCLEMIHTIGDSHSYSGFEDIENLVNHHIGPRLCYTYGIEKTAIIDFKNTDPKIEDGDIVILSLGEIDCRCHIHNFIQNNLYQNIIDEIVHNYFEAIKENSEDMNIKIAVYNVVPPVRKGTVEENGYYPFLGSDQNRLIYTLYFNNKLKEYCMKYGYIYFDIYSHYADKDGFLIRELSDGEVHIRDGFYIKEFLEKVMICSRKK